MENCFIPNEETFTVLLLYYYKTLLHSLRNSGPSIEFYNSHHFCGMSFHILSTYSLQICI